MNEANTHTFNVKTIFAGGRLSLDFVNTACQNRGVDLEFLGTPGELAQWLRSAEDIYKCQLLEGDEGWIEEYGEVMLARAIELRTAIHALVESVRLSQPAPEADVATLNAALHSNPIYSRIEGRHDGFREDTLFSHPADRWLGMIAQDAVDLLCHSDLSLLRQCECPTCVRVFLDTTKNHKRRWCVEKCGSAPKAAAYYRRKVAKAQAAVN